MANGKRQTAHGTRDTTNGKRETANVERRILDGKPPMKKELRVN